MADQVRHDVYNQIQQGEYWSLKKEKPVPKSKPAFH